MHACFYSYIVFLVPLRQSRKGSDGETIKRNIIRNLSEEKILPHVIYYMFLFVCEKNKAEFFLYGWKS